jgi:hypothetical protein
MLWPASNTPHKNRFADPWSVSCGNSSLPLTLSCSAVSRTIMILTCTIVGILRMRTIFMYSFVESESTRFLRYPSSLRWFDRETPPEADSSPECGTWRCEEPPFSFLPYPRIVLTLCSAQRVYCSTVDPTATWLGFLYRSDFLPKSDSNLGHHILPQSR